MLELDNQIAINSLDLSNFGEFSNSYKVKFFKLIVQSSLSSSLSIKSFLKNFWIFGFKGFSHLFTGLKKAVEDRIVQDLLEPKKVIDSLDPDFILFDNRVTFKNKAASLFAEHLSSSNRKIIMIPHAPYGATFDDEFFGIKEDYFPQNVEYWGCIRSLEPPEWFFRNENDSKYFFIGLPAIDESWKDFLKREKFIKRSEDTNSLYILYIPEKISEPDKDSSKDEIDIVGYQEELLRIKGILKDLDISKQRYRLVIKPHPKISINTIKKLIYDLSHKSVSSSEEPLYFHMKKADFVISGFSSAAIYCSCFIPIIRINTRQEQYYRKESIFLDELFGKLGLSYSSKNIKEMINLIDDKRKYEEMILYNRSYLSKFFGRNVSSRASSRLSSLENHI